MFVPPGTTADTLTAMSATRTMTAAMRSPMTATRSPTTATTSTTNMKSTTSMKGVTSVPDPGPIRPVSTRVMHYVCVIPLYVSLNYFELNIKYLLLH